MHEHPDSKRRKCYSTEPDVRLEVEGEIFHLQSQLLMFASPVFRTMLEMERWSEGQEGYIRLPGKSKDEFRHVLPFLDTMGASSDALVGLQPDAVVRLLHWAREYDIQGLRRACEALRAGGT